MQDNTSSQLLTTTLSSVKNTRAMNNFKRNTVAIAITAVLPVSMSFAEELKELPTAQAEVQSEESYKVDESSSVKYTQPLLDTPKTITVVSAAVMKDRNVDSLRDALRNVSGISMAAGEGGTPTGDSMSIRGFSSANNIMIDGVRDIAGYTRDVYNVEAIEVAKGPGSAVYGRGSAGGSVNLQTKTASLDAFNDVSLRIGSEADYRAKLDSNIVLGDTTAVRVNVLADDGDVAGRDEVFNSIFAGAVSFATGLNTATRFNVNADYQKQDNMPDYGIPWVGNYSGNDTYSWTDSLAAYEGGAPNVPFSNFYGNVNRDFEDITAQSITAKFEQDFNENTTLRILGRTGSVERQSIVNAPRFDYETDDDGNRIYGYDEQVKLGGEKTRDQKNSISVLQADLLGSYEIGSTRHDTVVGFEIASEKYERWRYEAIVEDNLESEKTDLYNPDAHVEFTGQYARTDKYNEAKGDTAAIYIFDTITFNEQWIVTAGLRYDRFDTEYFYQLDDADEPYAKVSTEDDFLSWNAGVNYKPVKEGSIYFAVGNSFTSSAEDLTASTSGNGADLDPEETMSYELGLKWEWLDGKIFTNAAIFRTDKTNALTDAEEGLYLDDDGRYDTLDGEQRVQGLELSVVGEVTPELTLTASYTYQQSEVLKAGGDDAGLVGYELPRVPEHSASFWGRYQVSDKLAVGLGSEFVGERYNSSDPEGREKADSYVLFDAMATYEISNSWNVQLNIENIADEEYIDQLGGGHFIPGPGRYASVSTTYSF